MPIIDKKDWNNWYNCIQEQADPVKRWEGFSTDKLQGNEIRCGEMILAKIPQVPELISRKTRRNEYGSSTTYIELITELWYDRAKHQTRIRRNRGKQLGEVSVIHATLIENADEIRY